MMGFIVKEEKGAEGYSQQTEQNNKEALFFVKMTHAQFLVECYKKRIKFGFKVFFYELRKFLLEF